jgi:hypothetical protein
LNTRNKTIQKLDQQIEKLDSLIEQLLDGIDISALSTSKRLEIAARLLTLSQQAVEMRAKLQVDSAEKQENILITRLMQHMRGEPVEEIIDASSQNGLLPPLQDA